MRNWYFAIFILSLASGCSAEIGPKPSILKIIEKSILSNPPIYAYDAQVTVSNKTGEIFTAWCQNDKGHPEIFWRHGWPGLLSHVSIISDQDNARSFNPSICASPDGRVYLAHMDEKVDGVREVYANTWFTDSWSGEQLLSFNDGWTGWDPVVDTYSDGKPVVCWFDHRFSVQHEIMMRIADLSGVWGPDIRLTNDIYWQFFPDIAIDNTGVVHLSYVDARTVDGGINTDFFEEGNNLEIYYRTWNGTNTGPEIRITDTPLRSVASQIAVDSSNRVHLIWLDESSSGFYQLYYAYLDGIQLSNPVLVSDPGKKADLASIACLGNRVFVVFPEYSIPDSPVTGNTSLNIREVFPDGLPGEKLEIESNGTNLHPRMAADRSRQMLWVIWMEYFGSDETLVTGVSNIKLCSLTIE